MTEQTDTENMSTGSGDDLAKRVVSAVVLGIVVLGAIWLGGWQFAAVVTIAAGLTAYEWCKVTGSPAESAVVLGAACGLAVLCTYLFGFVPGVSGLCLLAVLALIISGDPPRGWPAGGMLYAGVPALCLLWLRGEGDGGLTTVIWVMMVVWAADIGGYFVGRQIGGALLAPSISPKKTWSGAIGGLTLAFVTGSFLAMYIEHDSVLILGFASIILAVVSIIGDLYESRIKRLFGVKDSSNLIPGHGGIMDRVDGLLPAVVVLTAAQLLLQHQFIGGSG